MAYLKFFGDAERYDYFDKLLNKRMEVIEMSERMIEGLSEDVVEQILKISQEKQERDQLHRDNMIRKQDIQKSIRMLRGSGQSDEDIVKKIMEEYDFSEKEIRELL